MAKGEYYDGKAIRTPEARPGFLMWLVDGALLVLSVVDLLLLLIVGIVPLVNPAYLWALPMLGMVAPAIYLTAVVLMLYWVVRWKLLRAAVLAVPVVIGMFSVSLFWCFDSQRNELLRSQLQMVEEEIPRIEQDPTMDQATRDDQLYRLRRRKRILKRNLQPDKTIKALTFNVRSFYGDDCESAADAVACLIDSLKPDIICLQEFNGPLADRSERFQQLLGRYQQAYFGRAKDAVRPQMILSTHKIIASGVVLTPHSSVWADLRIGQDTVRVVSNHLHSTGITALDNAYITGYEYLSDTAREVKIRSIIDRFHENSLLRAAQVDSICHHLDSLAPSMRLICGDFNDTPISYTYRRLKRRMQDAFSEAGGGYSHTFRGFFNALRIDYVLLSRQFEVIGYETIDNTASDHLPVLVSFRKHTLYH